MCTLVWYAYMQCVYVCVCAHAGAQKPEDPPELELHVDCHVGGGTELGSFGGVAMAFICKAVLLEPYYCYL